MSREAFEKDIYSNVSHSITSENILVEKETGRVVAVFYNDYDLDSVVEQLAQAPVVAELDRISLLQYESLREHFQKMVDSVLGKDYYNMGMDVYDCDRMTCEDLTFKANLSWLEKLALKESKS